jgi:hypothetical protein
MTAEELHSRIPGIRADYPAMLEQAQKFPDFGVISFGVAASQTGKGEPFEGIEGFYFRLFDGRVVSYDVSYKGANSIPRGPTWARPDDLVARVAEAYHLPGSANWVGDGDTKTLKCKGFEVRISSTNGGHVLVTEPGNAWVAEQKKRREAYEEQLRHDFKP